MRAGNKKYRLSFRRKATVKGGLGQLTNETELANTRAEIIFQSGKEFFSSGAEQSNNKIIIRVRYQKKLSDLTHEDWAVNVHTGEKFNIQSAVKLPYGQTIEVHGVTA